MKRNHCFLRQFLDSEKVFHNRRGLVGGHLRGNNRYEAIFLLSLKNIYKGEEFGTSYVFSSNGRIFR